MIKDLDGVISLPIPRVADFVARTLLLGNLLLFICATASTMAGEDPSALNVEQSLGLLVRQPAKGVPWHLYRMASPGIRPALISILRSEKSASLHSVAFRILGFVGGAEDVGLFERAIVSLPAGAIEPERKKATIAAFEGLGLLCRRNVAGSEELVSKMCSPTYWADSKFRWHAEGVTGAPAHDVETISYLLYGYRLAGLDRLQKKVDTALVAMAESPSIAYLRSRLDRTLMSQQVEVVERSMSSECTADELRLLQAAYSEARAKIDAIKNLDDTEAQLVRTVRDEALKEFEGIQQRLLSADFDAIKPQLLDDGRILDAVRLHSQLKKYEKDLRDQMEILVALRALGSGPQLTSVERLVHFGGISAKGDEIVTAERKELVAVQFVMSGSQTVGEKLLSQRKGCATVGSDGLLYVVIKKIEGKWYWNPFGW